MKLNRPQYVNKFVKSNATVTLNSGETVIVYSIKPNLTEVELNEWAKHILNHYISAKDIQEGAIENRISKQSYIENFVLPTEKKDLSGNFGEIIFSDFIEYVLGFSVPRYRLYGNYPNNPSFGVDIVAYKMGAKSDNDTVFYTEIKSRLSKKTFGDLQGAIDDITKRSDKEYGLALDFARRKLKLIGNIDEANEIKRFSNSEKPYKLIKGAGLITFADKCSSNDFVGVNIAIGNSIEVHVIHANDIWNITQDLWRRASL